MFEELEKLNTYKVEMRFGKNIFLPGHLEKIINILNDSKRIGLVTGFPVQPMAIGETDGPLGTICLARALEKLGKETFIISDNLSVPLLNEGKYHYKLSTGVLNIVEDEVPDLDAIIFIERPGKNKHGFYSSMRGEDISSLVADTDSLFSTMKEKGTPVLAIGDGGNEAGMGLICDHIENNVVNGKNICATTVADFLLVSAVSNWGCYVLCAGLSKLNEADLLPDLEMEAEHLRKVVALGAVDGASKRNEMTVDGYPFDESLKVLEALKEYANR